MTKSGMFKLGYSPSPRFLGSHVNNLVDGMERVREQVYLFWSVGSTAAAQSNPIVSYTFHLYILFNTQNILLFETWTYYISLAILELVIDLASL